MEVGQQWDRWAPWTQQSMMIAAYHPLVGTVAPFQRGDHIIDRFEAPFGLGPQDAPAPAARPNG